MSYTNSSNRRARLSPKELRIGWINVGRRQDPHDAALSIAFEEGLDVLCIQEPWTSTGTLTKSHPAYAKYAPLDSWAWDDIEERETKRPRVLTYTKKSQDLQVQQRRLEGSRDLLWVDINGYTILNVYRAPNTDEVLDYIVTLVPPEKCLIGGDFNIHHDYFEPGIPTSGRGRELAEWCIANIDYIGETGVPTHSAGHVLDLTFSNIQDTFTWVRTDMNSGSDHETLVTIIPSRGRVPTVQYHYRVKESDLPRFTGLVDIGARALADPWRIATIEDLESLTIALENVFKIAIQTIGSPDRGGGSPAPWWTQECKDAYKAYLSTRQSGNGPTLEKRNFLSVVRRAKKEYWRHRIDNASSDTELYKIIGWYRKSPDLKTPPLKEDGLVIEDTLQKAEFLREKVLGRFSSEDDLAEDPLDDIDWPGVTYLPWEKTVSIEEVAECAIGVTSTSPGTDKITVRLLKAAWEPLKDIIHGIYSKCLEFDYFPDCWKYAEVAMIPKVGPGRDKTSYRSWRPIALLSCISKGFERLLARRITWTALKCNVLSPQHCGALPKRSAIDLVSSLMHDIEIAISKGLRATIVTLDVQGAFDALLRNRLLYRMRDQGWALSLLRLVRCFLTKRRIRVRLEDATTAYHEAAAGTPQGSPLSPIIYMLYLAELLNTDQTLRFGYADDICIYRVSRTLEENINLLEQDIRGIFTWGNSNKVFFAPEKLEMIHLTTSDREGSPNLVIDDRIIEPITTAPKKGQQPALKWLGVWFDRKLRFKRHIHERVTRARIVAHHIRRLGRTKDGPPAQSLRKAVVTCVLPSAMYGSEVWYSGRTRITGFTRDNLPKMVSTKLGEHIKSIGGTIALAARGILPVWRTSPIPTLLRDAGLPSAEVALEEARARFAVRIRTIDAEHPLAKRAPPKEKRRANWRAITRLQAAGDLLPIIPRLELRAPHFSPGCRRDPTEGLDKIEAAKRFKDWWKNLSPNDIAIFSDGSERYDKGVKGVGYGYAVYQNRKKLSQGYASISPDSHVFDAEVIGAWEGLHSVISNRTLRQYCIWMCIDSTSVIWGLRGTAAESSQWAFHACQDIIDLMDVRIKWSPGHTGIEGNEEADVLANIAASPNRPIPSSNPRADQPTVSGIRSIARQIGVTIAEKWWQRAQDIVSNRYKFWELDYRIRPPRELELSRATLHRLLALRTGHGDYKWYHIRFKHEDASNYCSCGYSKAPYHLVACKKLRFSFFDWPLKPIILPSTTKERLSYLKKLVASPQDFAQYLKITRFYTDICP